MQPPSSRAAQLRDIQRALTRGDKTLAATCVDHKRIFVSVRHTCMCELFTAILSAWPLQVLCPVRSPAALFRVRYNESFCPVLEPMRGLLGEAYQFGGDGKLIHSSSASKLLVRRCALHRSCFYHNA